MKNCSTVFQILYITRILYKEKHKRNELEKQRSKYGKFSETFRAGLEDSLLSKMKGMTYREQPHH